MPVTPPRTLLTPADAARTILALIPVLPGERVPLAAALERVLAEDVASPLDIPPWDNSAMDGYAVRSADLEPRATGRANRAGAGRVLRVGETIQAGGFPTRALAPGECARIFTGAPVPQGADGVIRQEDTTALDDDTVRIDDTRDLGRNIRRRGEDIRKGTVVVARGATVGPAQVGMLAAVAAAEVAVHRRPLVAVLASGDEIVDVDQRDAIVSGRKIASSNSYTIRGMVARAGGVSLDLGIAPDDPAELRRRLERATGTDLLVTSAGMSVGEHDYFRSVLEELGGTVEFWRLQMRPGAPVGFGRLGDVPWIGLPGNPVSTMVTFELFARPAIRKLGGHPTPFRRTVPVRVGEPIALGARLRHFLRVRLPLERGTPTAYLTGPQGSGMLSSMVRADALLIVPEDRLEVAAGETLRAIVLDEPVHVTEPPF